MFTGTMAVIRQIDKDIKNTKRLFFVDNRIDALNELYDAVQGAEVPNFRILLRRITMVKKAAMKFRESLEEDDMICLDYDEQGEDADNEATDDEMVEEGEDNENNEDDEDNTEDVDESDDEVEVKPDGLSFCANLGVTLFVVYVGILIGAAFIKV